MLFSFWGAETRTALFFFHCDRCLRVVTWRRRLSCDALGVVVGVFACWVSWLGIWVTMVVFLAAVVSVVRC